MEFSVAFSFGSSHILPIIQRSIVTYLMLFYFAYLVLRILLACTKFLGKCPCPRCFVRKEKIDRLGDKNDRSIRTYQYRIDDHRRQSWIERVREMIFVQGRSVISQAVERLIGEKSLVPTRVRFIQT